jgi:t-SNARE complex subunit (syntaxin)
MALSKELQEKVNTAKAKHGRLLTQIHEGSVTVKLRMPRFVVDEATIERTVKRLRKNGKPSGWAHE